MKVVHLERMALLCSVVSIYAKIGLIQLSLSGAVISALGGLEAKEPRVLGQQGLHRETLCQKSNIQRGKNEIHSFKSA